MEILFFKRNSGSVCTCYVFIAVGLHIQICLDIALFIDKDPQIQVEHTPCFKRTKSYPGRVWDSSACAQSVCFAWSLEPPHLSKSSARVYQDFS